MRRTARLFVVFCAGALAAVLMFAMLQLQPAAVHLPGAVAANMPRSGVSHPVTAVLLNFRGYDTLLEVAVLLLAFVGMLATRAGPHMAYGNPPGEPVVQALACRAAPLMALAAVYLLWAGAHRPGGAFQAGAVLAAAAVLLNLARLLPAWAPPGRWLRAGLSGGLLLFLALAVALSGPGALLQYPPQYAGALILLIEAGLTLSLGLILAGLFLLFSREGEAAP